MRSFIKPLLICIIGIAILLTWSCRKDSIYEPPGPHVSNPVNSLIASYVTVAPSSLTSPYWKTADYLKVTARDVSKNQLYGDGLMNMVGTILGLSSFNNGADPALKLKAAYDNTNLYIMAEWTDPQVNPEFARWFYNGPADPLKTETSNGWTQQGNTDRFSMAFEIQNASSASGSFSTVGCQAACHTSGTYAMHPDAGSVDIWNWNLAHSVPLGYAEDMVGTQDSLAPDAGQRMWRWNRKGAGARSGPAYEWDGTAQNVTLGNGQSSILKESFFLLNKTPFKGNIQKGDSIYHKATQPGECNSCHGDLGEGATEQAINSIGVGAKSRASLIDGMNNVADMGPYMSGLSAADLDNVVAYIKGLCGSTPGTYLQAPSGSNADIIVVSNVTPGQITNAADPSKNKHTTYQILIIRKLKTGNTDDVQFDPKTIKTYKFGVALMNKDGKNHIGSTLETLIFQ